MEKKVELKNIAKYRDTYRFVVFLLHQLRKQADIAYYPQLLTDLIEAYFEDDDKPVLEKAIKITAIKNSPVAATICKNHDCSYCGGTGTIIAIAQTTQQVMKYHCYGGIMDGVPYETIYYPESLEYFNPK
jgi:hypothetical protein